MDIEHEQILVLSIMRVLGLPFANLWLHIQKVIHYHQVQYIPSTMNTARQYLVHRTNCHVAQSDLDGGNDGPVTKLHTHKAQTAGLYRHKLTV